MTVLLILRHGKSAWPPNVPDRERPLAERGQRESRKIGKLLRSRDWLPDRVLSSPARRARETSAMCMEAAELPLELVSVEELLYSGSVADIGVMLRSHTDLARVMIVGHNPTFDMLLASLCPAEFAGRQYDKILATANLAVVDLGSEPPVLVDLIKPKKLP